MATDRRVSDRDTEWREYALATFTAPNQAASLTFQLTVNNGAGGTASDTTVVTVTAPTPANQSPVASAGPDQTVTGGSTVTLNGSGSADPDSDPLTYQWQQTAGTPTVVLSNANTVAASFTAPNQAAALTFELTVNDGRGGSASDSAVISVTTTAVPKPILYIANFNGPSITAYDVTNPATLNGNIPPNANLFGTQTLLALPSGVVLDKNGGLLVSNEDAASVTGYADALNLGAINGNIAADRNLQGGATGLLRPSALAINAAADLLFVAESNVGVVRVYANASTLSGNTSPVRTITSGDMNCAARPELRGERRALRGERQRQHGGRVRQRQHAQRHCGGVACDHEHEFPDHRGCPDRPQRPDVRRKYRHGDDTSE